MILDGLVTKAHSGFFTVHLTGTNESILCQAAGRLHKGEFKEDALAVGDHVGVERVPSEGKVTGRIVSVQPRSGALSRVDPIRNTNNREIRQVIMANVDLCVFVFACDSPAFSPRMLDRYLVGAEAQQLKSLIVASKVDLVGTERAREMFADYEHIGYSVIYISLREGAPTGLDPLRAALHNKLCVLTGKSGAGKSSLLNALKPGLAQQTAAVSAMLNKGRHTTVAPELFQLNESTWLADTPGLRAYQVWDVDAQELDGYYPDIAPLVRDCEFSNCSHRHEPGCAVRTAAAQGGLSPARYDSYQRLREELESQRKW